MNQFISQLLPYLGGIAAIVFTAASARLVPLIQKHVKNHALADALTAIEKVAAATLGNAAVAVQKDGISAGKIVILTALKQYAGPSLTSLIEHCGYSQAMVDGLLEHFAATALGTIPATPAAMQP